MKVLVFLLLCLPTMSWARGPISSGGGMAVICEQGEERKVQLLDYFEAEFIYGKKHVARASGDLSEDYRRLVRQTYSLQGVDENIDRLLDDSSRNLKELLRVVEWVNSEDLPFLNDQGKTIDIPKGCELKQLAIFYDAQGVLKIAKDYWEELDSMNQAALLLHEIFYKYERHFAELDSTSTRSYVRQILTPERQVPVDFDTHRAKFTCFSVKDGRDGGDLVDYVMYVYPYQNASVFQFSTFAGRPLLVLTTVKSKFQFVASRKIDRRFGPIMYPVGKEVNIEETIDVKTTHRKDWQVHFEFKSGSPITIQGLKNGSPLGDKQFLKCIK